MKKLLILLFFIPVIISAQKVVVVKLPNFDTTTLNRFLPLTAGPLFPLTGSLYTNTPSSVGGDTALHITTNMTSATGGNVSSGLNIGLNIGNAANPNYSSYKGIDILAPTIDPSWTSYLSDYAAITIEDMGSLSVDNARYAINQLGPYDHNRFNGNVYVNNYFTSENDIQGNARITSVKGFILNGNTTVSNYNSLYSPNPLNLGVQIQLDVDPIVGNNYSNIVSKLFYSPASTGTQNFTSDNRTFLSSISAINQYDPSNGHFTGNPSSFRAYADLQESGAGIMDSVSLIQTGVPMAVFGSEFNGTLSNAIGLYVNDMTSSDILGHITNRYGIYQAGTTDSVHLSGPTRVANYLFANSLGSVDLISPNNSTRGIIYSDTNGKLEMDVADLVWNDSLKYLGIHTSVPNYPIDIHNAANNMLALNNTATGGAFMLYQSSGTTKWKTGYNAGTNSYDIANISNLTTPLSISAVTNRAFFTDTVSASSFVKTGGTASQIMAANGSNITAGTGITISGGTISSTGSMTYPAAGIAVSTGSAWTTSITDNSANWNTAYTNRISSLTTTGSSGAATLISNVLNIPTVTLAGLGAAPAFTYTTNYIPFGQGTTTPNQSANLTYNGTALSAPQHLATQSTSGSSAQGAFAYGTLSYSDINHILTMQGNQNSYVQMEIQNTNSGTAASSDVIVTNNNGTATTFYGDFGMNSSGWIGANALNAANMVYLTATSGDLALGTTTSNAIHFVINGGTDAVTISTSGTVTIPNLGTAGIVTNSAAGLLSTTNGTGFIKNNGSGVFSYDNSTYQPLATNLTSIGSLANSSGVLSNNGSGTFSYTNTPSLGAITATSVNASGFVSTAVYAGSFTDGIIMDYTTGTGRFSVGASDGFAWYTGGLANTSIATLSSAGAFTAASFNGNIFTTGSSTYTGTAAATYTFPTASKTIAANDGSNWTIASQAIGDIAYATSTTAYGRLADVAVGSYLRSGGVGTAPLWSTLILPNAATVGDIMYASSANTITSLADIASGAPLISGGVGVVPAYAAYKLAGTSAATYTFPTATKTIAANDGTNWTISGQAIGDIPVASSTTAYGKLADVAVGSALISGGVGVAPSWGTVPIAAGGTAATTAAAALANLGAMAANTTATVLTPGTTVTWTPVAGVNQYTLTPAQTETLNMGTIPPALVGQEVYLEVNTSGTTSFTITFGTNIKTATTTLATGTVTAKLFVIAYLIQSTTNVVELYRTVAQ